MTCDPPEGTGRTSLPGDLRRAGWRAALLQPGDDGCGLGGFGGLAAASLA